MKQKLLSVLLVFLSSLALVCCSRSDKDFESIRASIKDASPSQVMEKMLECAVNEKYDEMLLYTKEGHKVSSIEAAAFAKLIRKSYAQNDGLKGFKILDEKIAPGGKTAKVWVVYYFRNGKEKKDRDDFVLTDDGWLATIFK